MKLRVSTRLSKPSPGYCECRKQRRSSRSIRLDTCAMKRQRRFAFSSSAFGNSELPSWRQPLWVICRQNSPFGRYAFTPDLFQRRWMGAAPFARSAVCGRSPAVSRLRAGPQGTRLFSHGNLLAGHACRGRTRAWNDAFKGRCNFTCRRDRQALRTFGRSRDPADDAHRLEACGKDTVLVFHSGVHIGKLRKINLRLVLI